MGEPQRRTRLCTLAAVLGVVLVAGCGGVGGTGEPATAAAPQKQRVALIVGSSSDDFYKAIECGARLEAAERSIDLDVQGPTQFDPALQVPIVNTVAAGRPDAIIIAPTDDTALYPPLKAATDSGSKLVLVDTTLKQHEIASAHIGSDYVLYGRQGAQQITRLTGGEGTVLGIFSPPGVSTNDQGRDGFAAELARAPGMRLLPFEFSNGAPGKSEAIVSATLAAHPDLAGVFTFNGGDAQGVVTALREAGVTARVTFVSGDAQPFQVKQLTQGLVKALVVQQARRMGSLAVEYAVRSLAGQPVPAETAIKTVVGTVSTLGVPDVADNLYRGR